MHTALLVIDVQASFPQRAYFHDQDLPAYLAAQNRLIEGALAQGLPVVRVFHQDGPEQPDNPFAAASGLIRPLDGLLPFEATATFTKHRHSALVGTGLDVWLVRQGVQRLIVSGIRTEQCCETTARHASDLGWAVDFVTEATLTFDIPMADGQLLRACDVRQRTEAALGGRFARLCTVDEALQRATDATASALRQAA